MPDIKPIREFVISGMSCGHCRSAVESAISELPGVRSVQVDLERGVASVEGPVNASELVQAVEEAGYQAVPVGSY